MQKSVKNATEQAKSESKKDEATNVVDEVDAIVDRKAHAIEMIEKANPNVKVIDSKELSKLGYKDFLKWLKTCARFGNLDKTMIFKKFGDSDRVNVKFFTAEHSYSISATKTYLGCIASCRKSRPGETWTRGSDLSDGKHTKETFDKIVRDIVSYEMKNLQCW